MLPAAVLLVFVLASSPIASSHFWGHKWGHTNGYYHYGHRKPVNPFGLWKKKIDACCREECLEGYHCRIQEFTNDAKCFPNDPCEELLCGSDQPCVLPPDAEPCCGSLCCAVTCPADQHCRIDALSAVPACFPDDPCQDQCTSDQPCIIPTDGTPAYCYSPPPDPCLNNECFEGSKCFVIDGEAACLSGCQLDSQDFEHGQVLNDTASPQCQNLKCSDGTMKTVFDVIKGSVCESSFYDTDDGCFFHDPTTTGSWCEARVDCQSKGGDLATIDYNGIKDFMLNTFQDNNAGSYPAWVGARDTRWLAGRDIQQENWGTGEPDQLKSCVSIDVDGKLLAEDCGTEHPYVCQLF